MTDVLPGKVRVSYHSRHAQDDQYIVREGLAAFCDTRPDLHIAGQCSDGLAAVEMIKSLAPDFAIIDLHNVLLDELEFALDELPDEQREVFVVHELEGRSFKELSAESGVNVNTLLSRKRYAVLQAPGATALPGTRERVTSPRIDR